MKSLQLVAVPFLLALLCGSALGAEAPGDLGAVTVISSNYTSLNLTSWANYTGVDFRDVEQCSFDNFLQHALWLPTESKEGVKLGLVLQDVYTELVCCRICKAIPNCNFITFCYSDAESCTEWTSGGETTIYEAEEAQPTSCFLWEIPELKGGDLAQMAASQATPWVSGFPYNKVE